MNFSNRSKPLDLSGRSIFITGGTGIVGRCLLDYVLEIFECYGTGPTVTVLSRNPEVFQRKYPRYSDLKSLNFVRGDLEDLSQLYSSRYTDVIHAAADTHSTNDPIRWVTQLVDGTRSVLEFAKQNQAERLLFVSSGAIYGSPVSAISGYSEDQYSAPLTTDIHAVYGNSKRMAEHLCSLYAAQSGGLECVIARCFAIVTPHIPMDGPYALGNFIRDAKLGRGIRLSGDGKAIRTYIDGRDMAHWMFTLLLKGRSGEAYNVGSDKPITMLELATLIRDMVDIDQPIEVAGSSVSSTRSIYIPRIDKAAGLGLRIETELSDALSEIIRLHD